MFANPKTRSLCCLLPVALFLFLVGRYWHPVYGFTSFLTLDSQSQFTRIAAVRETPVYLSGAPGSYDGQFYAQLAHHPLLNSPELEPAMDSYAYRARRILPSMIAWVLAAGNPNLIFDAYCVVNILAWLALSSILWRLLEVRSARAWTAWLGVMFSAGALFSVGRALTDLVALAFIAGALLLASRGRKVASALSLGAAALCRETALFSAVDLLVQDPRETKGRTLTSRIRLCCVAAAPLVAWALYVRWRVGPAHDEWGNFTWPLVAFAGKWKSSITEVLQSDDLLLTGTSLLTLAALTTQAIYIAVTFDRGDRWSRLGAAYLPLMAVVSTSVWDGLPGAACRVLLPMTLAFNLLAARRKAHLAWLLVGNLTVFSGFLFLKDVPYDEMEFSTTRTLSGAGIITRGEGWYAPEVTRSHRWLWTAQSADLLVRCWPESNPKGTIEFSVRAIRPTVVTITEGKRILWSSLVGTEGMYVSVSFPVARGRADLKFSSGDKPTVAGRDTRPLNFQVYDPKIVAQR